ncbi:MAG: hypothetical protein IPP44_14825 [Ideonella sp.]|nr:hypothetical protein [Ideonella sp.]
MPELIAVAQHHVAEHQLHAQQQQGDRRWQLAIGVDQSFSSGSLLGWCPDPNDNTSRLVFIQENRLAGATSGYFLTSAPSSDDLSRRATMAAGVRIALEDQREGVACWRR